MNKIEKEDVSIQEKKQKRNYCFDLAIKIIHLFATELSPF